MTLEMHSPRAVPAVRAWRWKGKEEKRENIFRIEKIFPADTGVDRAQTDDL